MGPGGTALAPVASVADFNDLRNYIGLRANPRVIVLGVVLLLIYVHWFTEYSSS